MASDDRCGTSPPKEPPQRRQTQRFYQLDDAMLDGPVLGDDEPREPEFDVESDSIILFHERRQTIAPNNLVVAPIDDDHLRGYRNAEQPPPSSGDDEATPRPVPPAVVGRVTAVQVRDQPGHRRAVQWTDHQLAADGGSIGVENDDVQAFSAGGSPTTDHEDDADDDDEDRSVVPKGKTLMRAHKTVSRAAYHVAGPSNEISYLHRLLTLGRDSEFDSYTDATTPGKRDALPALRVPPNALRGIISLLATTNGMPVQRVTLDGEPEAAVICLSRFGATAGPDAKPAPTSSRDKGVLWDRVGCGPPGKAPKPLLLKDVIRITTGALRAEEDDTDLAPLKKMMATLKPANKRRSVTVTFTKGEVWVLLCTSVEQKFLLAQALTLCVLRVRPICSSRPYDVLLADAWLTGQPEPDSRMDIDEVEKVLTRLQVGVGVRVSPAVLNQVMDSYDGWADAAFDYDDFTRLVHHLLLRPELQPVFDAFAGEDRLLAAEGIRRFFGEAQGEPITLSLARKRLSLMTRGRSSDAITPADFFAYLTDVKGNSWLRPEHEAVHQDMTQPLHHYYIMSSHNSALDGDQLASNASPQWLEMVLRQGYRCIELEVFDGPHGSPVVGCHQNGDPDSRLPIDAALETICENAFVRSPFPFILALEVHCSIEQAEALGDRVQWVFGDALYTKNDAISTLPEYSTFTPWDLRGRVLVFLSVKGTTPTKYALSQRERAARLQSKWGPVDIPLTAQSLVDLSCFIATDRSDDGGFAEPCDVEIVTSKRLKRNAADRWVEMTQRMMIRTFSGSAASDNCSPIPGILSGVQMTSMNAQTCDENLRLYEAWFRQNGGAGWVLKPGAYRRPPPPDEGEGGEATADRALRLTLTLQSVLQLDIPADERPPLINCFIQVTVYGATGVNGDAAQSRNTRVVPAQCLSAVFNETMEFSVASPETTLVALRVVHLESREDDLVVDLAEAVAPLCSIRCGYRAVPLRSCHSNALIPNACIMCHMRVAKTHSIG